ncbi:MAG: dTDP-4-dehydrorhamnose 3,5-epimerase [Fibrobacterales bacterium]|nr:dTDP-4-dehydrorhamnose 3,5-epimerase [Fibrobacterales bacterium]
MQIEKTPIEGLLLVTPKVFRAERGFFMESWRKELWSASGIGPDFVQDNHSASVKNTLRGLHFQTSPGQGKLLRCTRGRIWDVAVDLRPFSPTLGKWFGVELDDKECRQFWIPVGFAHGFCVLSDYAEVQYKCTAAYDPRTEAGIAWNDPEIGVKWPIENPLLSMRDQTNPTWEQWRASH